MTSDRLENRPARRVPGLVVACAYIASVVWFFILIIILIEVFG